MIPLVELMERMRCVELIVKFTPWDNVTNNGSTESCTRFFAPHFTRRMFHQVDFNRSSSYLCVIVLDVINTQAPYESLVQFLCCTNEKYGGICLPTSKRELRLIQPGRERKRRQQESLSGFVLATDIAEKWRDSRE